MSDALEITVMGMGLVFGAILILWAVMSLMVWISTTGMFQEVRLYRVKPDPVPSDPEHELKQRAAAIAVVIALAQKQSETEPHLFPLPPTPIVSAWQAVMRADRLRQKGNIR